MQSGEWQVGTPAERASPCLSTTHEPLEANKMQWLSRARRGSVLWSGCRGDWTCCVQERWLVLDSSLQKWFIQLRQGCRWQKVGLASRE
jgi:hypothetical protein